MIGEKLAVSAPAVGIQGRPYLYIDIHSIKEGTSGNADGPPTGLASS